MIHLIQTNTHSVDVMWRRVVSFCGLFVSEKYHNGIKSTWSNICTNKNCDLSFHKTTIISLPLLFKDSKQHKTWNEIRICRLFVCWMRLNLLLVWSLHDNMKSEFRSQLKNNLWNDSSQLCCKKQWHGCLASHLSGESQAVVLTHHKVQQWRVNYQFTKGRKCVCVFSVFSVCV
jgi:hypothetical protein